MLAVIDAWSIECEWGLGRLFGSCDIGSNGLISGWSDPEPAHVWNDGPDAHFRLSFPGPARRAVLSVEGMAFIRPRQPSQDITLYVNGFRLGFWRLFSAGGDTLSAAIEPEQMFARGDQVVLDCTFHIPTCVRPMDLGEGNDRRQLGFCFFSVLVREERDG